MPIKTNRAREKELVNENVPNTEMLVIDEDGTKLGVLTKAAALKIAEGKGLDLVVVSPDSKVVVAKLMDFSKHRYDQQKKLKEMRKSQQIIKVKETKLSPTIDKHDFDTRLRQTKRFIEKGDKVKVSLRFRGRMIVHSNIGLEVINRFLDEMGDMIVVESKPKVEGRIMMAVIAPNPNYKKEKEE